MRLNRGCLICYSIMDLFKYHSNLIIRLIFSPLWTTAHSQSTYIEQNDTWYVVTSVDIKGAGPHQYLYQWFTDMIIPWHIQSPSNLEYLVLFLGTQFIKSEKIFGGREPNWVISLSSRLIPSRLDMTHSKLPEFICILTTYYVSVFCVRLAVHLSSKVMFICAFQLSHSSDLHGCCHLI